MKKTLAAFLGVLAFAALFADKVTDAPERQTAGTLNGCLALTNITYKEADGEKLQFDIAYPEGEAPNGGWPLILYLHGGGWTGGERRSGYGFYNGEVRFYNSKGIAVASASYRFCRPSPNPRTVEDCVVDVKDAARFIAKNSRQLRVNSNKMGVYGHSAGGHLTMMAALAPNSLFKGDKNLLDADPSFACAVPQSGPTSLVDPEADDKGTFTQDPSLMTMRLGESEENIKRLSKLLSPSEYLSEKSPPMLVIQGAKDNIVSVKAALFMDKKAKETNAPVEIFISETGGHSFENGDHNDIARHRRDFFLKHLIEN